MDIGICRSVVDRLAGLDGPPLCVGSMAMDRSRPVEQYADDDIRYLVREADLEALRDRMEAGRGFRLVVWDPAAGGTKFASDALIGEVLYARPRPRTPGLGYSDQVGSPYPLYIQFYTSWRHGPLLLVDLTGWFADAEGLTSTIVDRHIMAPPPWALVLWQAYYITVQAASGYDRETIRPELAKLYELTYRLGASQQQWNDLREKAQAYDTEYLTRLERIRERIETYAGAQRVSCDRLLAAMVGTPPGRTPQTIANACLDYGVLYDLRYAFEALEAYYPGAVPDRVRSEFLAALQQGTGARPRKIWHCEGDREELGVAAPEFGICDQIEQHADRTWQQLQSSGLVSVKLSRTPLPGYWQDLTQDEFQDIWAPLR